MPEEFGILWPRGVFQNNRTAAAGALGHHVWLYDFDGIGKHGPRGTDGT